MEDGAFLSQADRSKLDQLKKELAELKAEHKSFAAKKSSLSLEDRDRWRLNSQRTNEVFIAIKDLRLKNVFEAGKG